MYAPEHAAAGWPALLRISAALQGALALVVAAVWQALPPRWRDRCLDAAASVHARVRAAREAVLAYIWVYADPFGRARAPIPIRVGRAREPGAVFLLVAEGRPFQLALAGAPTRAHRLLAFFWGRGGDQTCPRLDALGATFLGRGRCLAFAGVLAMQDDLPDRLPLPVAFRVAIDPREQTVTLRHASPSGPECFHEARKLPMNSAALADVLAPLVGRTPCPGAKRD